MQVKKILNTYYTLTFLISKDYNLYKSIYIKKLNSIANDIMKLNVNYEDIKKYSEIKNNLISLSLFKNKQKVEDIRRNLNNYLPQISDVNLSENVEDFLRLSTNPLTYYSSNINEEFKEEIDLNLKNQKNR